MPASKSEGTNSSRLLQKATSVAKTVAHRRWRVSICVMNEKLCGTCVVFEDRMHWFLPSTAPVRRILRTEYRPIRAEQKSGTQYQRDYKIGRASCRERV